MAPLPPGTRNRATPSKRDDLIVDIETDKVVLEVLAKLTACWALSSRTKATPFCPNEVLGSHR